MIRKETREERRSRLVPILTRAFMELGYRRATTAELAARCQLRENELYRIWKNKKAMFVDAVMQVYRSTIDSWTQLADEGGEATMAERVLAHQAANHGNMGFYRIVFAGLQEVDDPEIRAALRKLYRNFHKAIVGMIVEHHAGTSAGIDTDGRTRELAEMSAWAIIGLGAIADIDCCVKLTSASSRKQLIGSIDSELLELPAKRTTG